MNAPVPLLEATDDLLPPGPEFNQAVLNALDAHVAVLKGDGTIVGVNQAWHRFALENGAPEPRSVGVGANYLEIARQAAGPDSDEAQAAYSGIRRVLEGSIPQFTLE